MLPIARLRLPVRGQVSLWWEPMSWSENWRSHLVITRRRSPATSALCVDMLRRTRNSRSKPSRASRQEHKRRFGSKTRCASAIPAGYFKQHPFADIDYCFYSCEMGLRKPEPGIYEKALQALSCRAENAVFIDDRQGNVEAASSMGISSILFCGCEDLREQLLRCHIRL